MTLIAVVNDENGPRCCEYIAHIRSVYDEKGRNEDQA